MANSDITAAMPIRKSIPKVIVTAIIVMNEKTAAQTMRKTVQRWSMVEFK